MKLKLLSVAVLALLAFTRPQAQGAGALLFDSFDDNTDFTSSRTAGNGIGCHVSVSSDVTIAAIAVYLITGDCNVKFVISDDSNNAIVYVSDPKAFSVNDDPWKISNDFSFTLLAGKDYNIGAISDQSGSWGADFATESANGISSVLGNGNFTNFTTPTMLADGGTDATIRLYGVGEAIPEPTTVILVGLGLAGAGVALRRRS